MSLGQPGLLGRKEMRELQEQPVRREIKAAKAAPELRALLVQRVLRDRKESRA